MMKSAKNFRWYRPVLELVVATLLYVLFVVLLFLLMFAWAEIDPQADNTFSSNELDMYDPFTLFSMLGHLAVAVPAIVIAARWPGRRGGTIFSVAGRIRWSLLGRAFGIAALVSVGVMVVGVSIHMMRTGDPVALSMTARALVLAGLIVFVVPFQAAAEELLFRGLIPQIAGAWGAPAWLAYAIPIPLFVLGHEYNWIGLIDIAVFAAAVSLLTHRSGGLELAIGLHAANNTIFFLAGAFGLADLNATDIGLGETVVDILGIAVATFFLVTSLPREPRRELSAPAAPASCDPEQPVEAEQPLYQAR